MILLFCKSNSNNNNSNNNNSNNNNNNNNNSSNNNNTQVPSVAYTGLEALDQVPTHMPCAAHIFALCVLSAAVSRQSSCIRTTYLP